MVTAYTARDLKPVLMKGARPEVKTPYYLINDGDNEITVVSAGHNGSEFNKTAGYFNNFPGIQIFQCLYGQGILVMQRNDDRGEAKEFKVVSLNPGRQVLVPAGWGMCLINTSSNYLVVVGNSSLSEKYKETKTLLEKHGFAYFVVEKRGEISFEENHYYSLHPQITTE